MFLSLLYVCNRGLTNLSGICKHKIYCQYIHRVTPHSKQYKCVFSLIDLQKFSREFAGQKLQRRTSSRGVVLHDNRYPVSLGQRGLGLPKVSSGVITVYLDRVLATLHSAVIIVFVFCFLKDRPLKLRGCLPDIIRFSYKTSFLMPDVGSPYPILWNKNTIFTSFVAIGKSDGQSL